MRPIRTMTIGAVLTALLLPVTAAAHVTVAPETAKAGEAADLTLRVPNESPTENVIELSVQFSPAVDGVRPGEIPGWEIDVEESDGKVRTVTWSGNGNSGRIEPNAAGEFPLAVDVPGDADRVTIKAVERYDGGKVSRWIGEPDAENPAPVVRVSGASAEPAPEEPAPAPVEAEEPTATTGVPATEAPAESPSADAAPAAAEDEDEDGGGGGVVIAIVIALLVGAGVGVVVLRRRQEP